MAALELIVIEQQSLLRLLVFILLLLSMLLLERLFPRRQVTNNSTLQRRIYNLSLLVINVVAVRILVPLALFQAALFAAGEGIGLFNFVKLPLWLNLAASIVLFDLLIYLQHVAFHKLTILWRIHRIHHTDLQFDVTTGVRFHPLEILLSTLYKLVAVFVFGPAAFAIIIYEIALNAAALFTHGNLRLTGTIDKGLRQFVVTPDMHRVHHSVIKTETDSNYGNIFSFWDRLFRTYKDQPEAGHEGMQIGLQQYRDVNDQKLMSLLTLPFRAS